MGYETEKQNVPERFTDLGEDMGKHLNMESQAEHESPKVHYPELHFEGEHAKHLMKHLPKHGTAHIHFKKVSESTHHSTHKGKEKTRHSVGIQIHGIKPMGENGKEISMKTPKENPEDSIEKGLEAAETETTE